MRRTGPAGGYGADVFEMEDWAREDHPSSIPQGLLDQRDRTVLTPHIGSAVQSIRDDIAMTAARNLKALVQTTLIPDQMTNTTTTTHWDPKRSP